MKQQKIPAVDYCEFFFCTNDQLTYMEVATTPYLKKNGQNLCNNLEHLYFIW